MNVGLSTSVIQRGQTGIAQYVFALVAALSRHRERHELTLFVLEDDLPLFDFAAQTARIVPVAEHFRPPVNDILWHQTVLPLFARSLNLDVLHVPSYRRMLWQRPCALVTTIHDLAPFHVAGKYDWKRMFYGRVVARQLAQRQDQIITVSQNSAGDILKFFKTPAHKVTVIHNGIEHDRFFPDSTPCSKEAVSQRYNLQNPFFLYVARLEHPGKNHVRLIHAFNQFKAETGSDWLLVLGGSDWHGAQAIHKAIDESPFRQDIRCLGFVENEVLPLLYRAASVFVYPSLFEGFGLPPLEAMACGCPVLCSARGSLGEVVGGAAVTVNPEDVTALARQLAALSSQPDLRDKLRALGLEQARRFDWQLTATRTLDVYAAALRKERFPAIVPAVGRVAEN